MSTPPLPRPVALVTGASRGIGRAIALRLAAAHDLILVARDADRLQEVARACEEAGAAVQRVPADVTDGLATAEALTGLHVDVLVNNAGVAVLTPFLEMTAEEWHRQVDVNVNALYHVTRAVLPGMVARGRGHVCIIGSTAGRNTFVGGTCYTGTKHFVMGFAESLMLEVRDAGVGVSVITPGSVATELFPAGTNTTWMLEPDNVAAAVAFAVTTPQHMLVHRLEVRPLSPKRPRSGT
ncbi:MAG: SDR family oxidoreductase [Gemmatimonas sp.]|jgi:NADP-dependent 3-hydroxy acid dehydrogenase YdfG|uniref:SDR family oxidoreductase n=1 Tax=Gemmatimonas sp. TaxID=1962908 RepID=UPI00391F7BF0|nr:SDR family oxidoreductase [Gemmatimonadota bacterium]